MYHNGWLIEAHVECKGEGYDKKEGDKQGLHKRGDHLDKHQYIDPYPRKLVKEEHEINPGQEHSNGAKLPLPACWTGAPWPEQTGKDDREHKESELHPVTELKHVAMFEDKYLRYLQDEPKDSTQNDSYGNHKHWRLVT